MSWRSGYGNWMDGHIAFYTFTSVTVLQYINITLKRLAGWLCWFFFSFSASVAELTQVPDSAAQCQQRECFSAQISTPHKCLALCLTLSGLWLSAGGSSRGQAPTLKDSCACLCGAPRERWGAFAVTSCSVRAPVQRRLPGQWWKAFF